MAGLRAQWRRTAMRTIQEQALDLFDERGFDDVTIEQIAAAAGVSPSSIYRYFGTKEGLLVADDFETLSDEDLARRIDPGDPVGSLLGAVLEFEPSSPRRVRYFFSEPSVRAAVLATLDRAAQRVAPVLATGQGRNAQAGVRARVLAHALAFGYFAALECWFDDGGTRPIAEYVEQGLGPLRTFWSTG